MICGPSTEKVIRAASAPMLIVRAWCWACFSGRVEPRLEPTLEPPSEASVCSEGAFVEVVEGADGAAFLLEKSESGCVWLMLVDTAICVDVGA